MDMNKQIPYYNFPGNPTQHGTLGNYPYMHTRQQNTPIHCTGNCDASLPLTGVTREQSSKLLTCPAICEGRTMFPYETP